MAIQAVRGVKDILPEDMPKWHYVERIARRVLETHGYQEIRTPIFEKTALFTRGIGETTDIVEKEMYTFADKGGEMLTLRPEATAAIARAYTEHKLYFPPGVFKVYCIGPMFRYERPQAGRYRQFYQIDAEALGSSSPYIDAEIIVMLITLLHELGLEQLALHLNTLGDAQCRPLYREELRRFLGAHLSRLCPDCQGRYERNPLRILDCKNPQCQQILTTAPTVQDYLCPACRQHFETVLQLLTAVDVPYVLDARLVRGLDYYTRTTFEILAPGLGAQNAVVGGGRYDGLVEAIGGPSTPGIGFAIGMERLIALLEEKGVVFPSPQPMVFLAALGEQAQTKAFQLVCTLRRLGIAIEMEYEPKSLKSQLRRANKLGVRYTLILGEDELSSGKIVIKEMQGEGQERIDLSQVVPFLQQKLALV
ncbi:MAG: histidine--tRNA ligase [Nitrospinota bacterium]|nr:MAG: histidine--tRNA ligase [Nitrospinota bacterium]